VRIWVIDTISVTAIRRVVPGSVRPRVISELDSRATSGVIVYPPQVLGGLERGAEGIRKKGRPDIPRAW
jgi:hypothetical protein